MSEKKGFRFTKMHGIGNDYVYMDAINQNIPDPFSWAVDLSNRHFGIGSDGLVLICPSDKADFRMRMFNSDGSEAEMCGNASRCVGKFVYEKGLTNKKEILLETGAGIKVLSLTVDNNNCVSLVKVDMGEPILEAEKIPVLTDTPEKYSITIEGKEYIMTAVSMGNPHAVTYVDSLEELDLEKIGPEFESNELYPRKTNTEFVVIESPTVARMRVWERGSGETIACGTGACATLVSGVINKKLERRAKIKLIGGDLNIEWNKENNHVYMTGPATTVFEGVLE